MSNLERLIRSHNRVDISSQFSKGIYTDNYLNRKLGRVGQTYGKDVEEEIRVYRKETTAHIHKENGEWKTERETDVHDKILSNTFRGKVSGNAKPIATILLGGSGSGKSYVYETYHHPDYKDDENSVYINADDVKEALPEHQEFMKKDFKSAAAKLHEESSYISNLIINEAITDKYNFTYDTTLSDLPTARKLIDRLKKEGYEVNLIGVDVPYQQASYSARRRSYTKGRFVPEYVVKAANHGARNTLKTILREGLVDNVTLWDNSGLNKLQPPKQIISNNSVKDKSFLQNLLKSK